MREMSVSRQRPVRTRNSSGIVIESMEARELLSASINASGWTVITPPVGAKVVYASSSTGNDKNSGLSPSSPVKTLAKGESLLRNNSGDELLLKSGDSWSETFGTWKLSGASAQSPIVIGSYGTGARPRILSGTLAGFLISNVAVNNLSVMGINFDASGRDPTLTSTPAKSTSPTGFDVLGPASNILVENCEFQYYAINMNFQNYWGAVNNVSVRRNIDVNSYAFNGHSEGLYALGVHGLNLYGNVFDQDGYNNALGAWPNIYNHDAYISSENTGVVVSDNVFSRASATGLQARAGGIITNNLFVNNPVGLTYGLVNGANATPGGVTGSITGNVFMGGGSIGSTMMGIGVEIGNIKPGAGLLVSNNIFSTGVANSGPAIELTNGSGQLNPSQLVGINDVTISHNTIYNWREGIVIIGGLKAGGTGVNALNRLTIASNQFDNIPGLAVNQSSSYLSQEHWSGNVYYKANLFLVDLKHAAPIGTILSSPIPFVAPTRSVTSYDQSIGGPGSIGDLMTLESRQSEAAWNTKLDALSIVSYISGGFAP